MNKTVRVIGIGSPVEGDRVGMQLVERLRNAPEWSQRDEIEWLVLERPGAALLQTFSGVETVCLIDALEGGDSVRRIVPQELLAQEVMISSHHIGVAEALQLAELLNQLPPRLLIYGVSDRCENYAPLSAMLAEDLG